MDGFRLAVELAKRMREIAPPGVTIVVDGDKLWFDCARESGEHHRSGTYACQGLNAGKDSEDRLTKACWHAFDDFRAFVDEFATSRPWPAVWPIQARSVIEGRWLLIWYEGEAGRQLLDIDPVPLDKVTDRHEGSDKLVLIVDRSLPMPAPSQAEIEGLCARRGEIVDVLTARLGDRLAALVAYSEIAYHWPPTDKDVWLRQSPKQHVLAMEPFEWFDPIYGANLAHALELGEQACIESGCHRILVVTYSEPSAHNDGSHRETFFSFPPVRETFRAVEEEAARCRDRRIRIETVALGGYGENAGAELASLAGTLAGLTAGGVMTVASEEPAADAVERILQTLDLGHPGKG